MCATVQPSYLSCLETPMLPYLSTYSTFLDGRLSFSHPGSEVTHHTNTVHIVTPTTCQCERSVLCVYLMVGIVCRHRACCYHCAHATTATIAHMPPHRCHRPMGRLMRMQPMPCASFQGLLSGLLSGLPLSSMSNALSTAALTTKLSAWSSWSTCSAVKWLSPSGCWRSLNSLKATSKA
jgi:hypothetical protein